MGNSAAGRVQYSHDISWGGYINHQDWFDPNDPELHNFMSRRDQAHQRVMQTRSTRSTTAAYKEACRLLQKTHPCTEVRLVGKEGSGAAEI